MAVRQPRWTAIGVPVQGNKLRTRNGWLLAGLLLAPWGAPANQSGSFVHSRAGQLEASERTPLALAHVDSLPREGEEIFKRQCAVCHGEGGEGNGPAAVALRPKPADLTNPDRQKIPEQDVMATIQKGKGTMPAFGAVLKKDQLEAVARYVVSLSAGSQ